VVLCYAADKLIDRRNSESISCRMFGNLPVRNGHDEQLRQTTWTLG